MKNHVIDGFNLIRMFDFLIRFAIEVDTLNMSEPRPSSPFRCSKADPAENQFRTSLSGCATVALPLGLRPYNTCFVRT